MNPSPNPSPSSFHRRVVASPVGALELLASPEGLAAILFVAGDRVSPKLATDAPPPPPDPAATRWLDAAERQLSEYFAGARRTFDLPLAPATGTPFERQVWDELMKIPFGATISYGELARRVGRPGAARAVGRANGDNPLPIVVPCHRVIGAGGKLTGYGGGLPNKEILLRVEGAGEGGAATGQGTIFDETRPGGRSG